ncbi:hypothetical protein HPB47_019818 [Ixodes persulcatus]|uniref:Uncharacterized protein n=1 Tax=Ixodes persulcatus TaxID=34615 RepID=A0AC60QI32_IXOPE|nr:hypothetical protein HPB47_019818 [Ixodes persulcatus]
MQTDFSDLLTLATAADAFAWSPIQREGEMPTLQREAPFNAPLAPSVAPTPLRTGAITPGSSLNAPAPPPAQSEAYRSPHGETAAAPHHTLLENAARVIESLTGSPATPAGRGPNQQPVVFVGLRDPRQGRKARRPGTSCSRSSRDKSLRLWDLCAPNCQGVMHLTDAPWANSTRRASSSPCGSTWSRSSSTTCAPSTGAPSTRSSCPGTRSATLNGAVIHLIDAFQVVLLVASFSPDSQFRLQRVDGRPCARVEHSGGPGGGLRTVVLNCDHTDAVHCYQFSPKYAMLVAACWTIWATTWP